MSVHNKSIHSKHLGEMGPLNLEPARFLFLFHKFPCRFWDNYSLINALESAAAAAACSRRISFDFQRSVNVKWRL